MKAKINKISKIIVLSLIAAFMSLTTTYSAKLSGKQIATKAKYVNRPNSRFVKSVMILKSYSNGKWKTEDVRKVVMMSMKYTGNRIRTISRFMTGLKKGVTFLSIEMPDNQDDVSYSYLPELRRPRRISSSERQNDFEDTDLTNEEMGSPKISDYTYKRLPDESYRGMSCYVLERYPRDKSKAKYSKHKLWITKKHFIPIKTLGYDMNKRLKKRGYMRAIKKFGPIWMPTYIKVINVQKMHMTILKSTKIRVNIRLERSNFLPSRMSATWRMR